MRTVNALGFIGLGVMGGRMPKPNRKSQQPAHTLTCHPNAALMSLRWAVSKRRVPRMLSRNRHGVLLLAGEPCCALWSVMSH